MSGDTRAHTDAQRAVESSPSRPRRREAARPAPTHSGVAQLQRSVGNAAVSALMTAGGGGHAQEQEGGCVECGTKVARSAELAVQRDLGGWLSSVVSPASQDAKRYFKSRTFGPQDLRAPTRIGGFSATYTGPREQLLVGLRGGVNFVDGLTMQGSTVVANQPKAAAQTAANAINALPPAERAARLAEWQWGAEKDTWLRRFETRVHDAWRERYEFHVEKEGWRDVGANVEIQVGVHEGAKTSEEHMSMTVYKVPEAFVGGVGVVNSGTGGVFGIGAARDNTMTLNSNDVDPRRDNLLDYDVEFNAEDSSVDDTLSGRIQKVAKTFKAGRSTCATCGAALSIAGPVMTIRYQGDGDDPEHMARDRFDGIRVALTAGGFTQTNERTTFEYAGEGTTCTLVADSGAAQVVAAHEAGHMFGLGDEYATGAGSMISGTGAAAGVAAKHDQLSKDMGLDGAVHENNDNIMSLGNVVQPQHYSTFLWALKELTAEPAWALGPKERVGDFPLGGPGGTAPATPPTTAVA